MGTFPSKWPTYRGLASCLSVLLNCWPAEPALGATLPVRSDRPYAVSFPADQAKFVRIVIDRTSGGAAAIDELEVYGPDSKGNLALAGRGAKASASSCISGYTQHAIEHLNDGRHGNDFSWVAATANQEWAQIELPRPAKVDRVVFSRLPHPGPGKRPAGRLAPDLQRERTRDRHDAVLVPVVGRGQRERARRPEDAHADNAKSQGRQTVKPRTGPRKTHSRIG
jgi:hypothetical protein